MADPDFVFMDGFDKYGPLNIDGEQFIRALGNSNEWSGFFSNSSWSQNFKAGQPIGTIGGSSLQLYDNDGALYSVSIYKNVPAAYPRTIGGVYYKASSINNAYQVVTFCDVSGTSIQVYIGIDAVGKLGVWRGPSWNGTRIATGTYTYSPGTAIGVEWDITFSNTAGIVKVWVDGVLDINITGQDTCSTANENFSRVYLGVFSGVSATPPLNATLNYDHFYLWCYSAAGGTETPVGAGFQVQTSFPTADSTPSQFSSRKYIGNYAFAANGWSGNNTDIIMTGPFTVPANCSALGIVWWPANTTTTPTTYVGLYAASGGAPTTLLGQLSTTSVTTQDATALYFATPIALTAGSQFFLAYSTNDNVTYQCRFGSAPVTSYRISRTPFGPLPATSAALGGAYSSQMAIGLIASGFTSGKFDTVDMNPALSSFVYNFDSTVNDVDAYSFGGLEGSPTSITYVALKGAVNRTNTGSRTGQLEVDSSGTVSAGTLGAFTPSVIGGNQNGGPIYGTYFKNDPATSAAWTNSAAAGIKGRVKVVS